jgi:hypothetical protein
MSVVDDALTFDVECGVRLRVPDDHEQYGRAIAKLSPVPVHPNPRMDVEITCHSLGTRSPD